MAPCPGRICRRRAGVRISIDRKGRYLDNIFIQRLWPTLKYECVYLHAWKTGSQARTGVRKWMGSITSAARTGPLAVNHRRWSTHCKTKSRNLVSRSKE
jgi:transposase InsO family protein